MSVEEIAAFVFTDLVGSSAAWELDPTEMSVRLSRHDAITQDCFGHAGGELIKHLGDGVVAVFASSKAAILATVDLQRRLADEPGLSLRSAVDVGSAERRDGDWFGPALNRCARLCAIAHGGQILVSDTAAELVGGPLGVDIALRALGVVRLRGIRAPVMVSQVDAPGLHHEFAPLDGIAINTLPTPSTPLIGRDALVEEVSAVISSGSSLVTVTGVGGTGKTRLAIAVADRSSASMPDGVMFADLSDATDLDTILAALAQSARLPVAQGGRLGGDGHDVAGRVLGALAARDAVLVLDNCEHVLELVGDLVEMLQDRAGSLRVLATSREPLGVDGERVVRIPQLDDRDGATLLAERARRAGVSMDLSGPDRRIAEEISHRLDGLPLAIELAAARLRAMSPAELVEALNDRFRVLAGRGRRHDRHTTLRAALDWSHDLLDVDEQALFARLSVFVGGFDMAGAREVCSDTSMSPDRVEELLFALVDKSLVVVGPSDPVPGLGQPDGSRMRLLETIQAYAAERLHERGEHHALATQHLRYVTQMATEYWAETARANDAGRMPASVGVRTNLDNLRAGHEWAVEIGDGAAAQTLASAFAFATTAHGLGHEARERCERALALEGGTDMTLCMAHCGAAHGALWSGSRAWDHLRTARDLSSPQHRTDQLVWFVAASTAAVDEDSEFATADECFRQARHLSPAQDHYWSFLEGFRMFITEGAESALACLQKVFRRSDPDGDGFWAYLVVDLAVLHAFLDREPVLDRTMRARIEARADPVADVGLVVFDALEAVRCGEATDEHLMHAAEMCQRLLGGIGSVAALGAWAVAHRGDSVGLESAAVLLGATTGGQSFTGVMLAREAERWVQARLDPAEVVRLSQIGEGLPEREVLQLALESYLGTGS